MTTPTAAEATAPLDAARSQGRRDGEAFDQDLRQQEMADRETRLAQLAWRPGAPQATTVLDEETSYKLVQLEAQVSELGAYVKAVESSTPWRVIQWFRRLMGRAW